MGTAGCVRMAPLRVSFVSSVHVHAAQRLSSLLGQGRGHGQDRDGRSESRQKIVQDEGPSILGCRAAYPAADAARVRERHQQPVRPEARLLRLLGQPRDRQVVQHARRHQGAGPELRNICGCSEHDSSRMQTAATEQADWCQLCSGARLWSCAAYRAQLCV